MSNSVRPQRRQPTRLRRPWDSPGKNTGVGCHFLLQCMKVKVKSCSRVRLFATPWTTAYQAPPSMGFSRQEYWSGVPLPSLIPTLWPSNYTLIYSREVKTYSYIKIQRMFIVIFFMIAKNWLWLRCLSSFFFFFKGQSICGISLPWDISNNMDTLWIHTTTQ